MGTLVPWASSTILITWDKKVSFPILVASIFSRPSWLMVAPKASSPGLLLTGMDSPVAMDSSTELSPSTITPSVGIFSPGLTIIRAPTSTSWMGTSFSTPSTMIVADFASILRRLLIAWEALPLALASKYLPVMWKDIIMAPIPA